MRWLGADLERKVVMMSEADRTDGQIDGQFEDTMVFFWI